MGNETVSFYSRRILTEQGMVEGVLQVADGKFAGLIENPNPAQIAAARDFADQRIFAGIIDLHSHGYRSWSAKTIDKAEIQGLSKILRLESRRRWRQPRAGRRMRWRCSARSRRHWTKA